MRKRILYSVVVFATIFLAGWGFIQYQVQQTKQRYSVAIQEAATWNLPTTLDELVARHAVPKNAENGFELLMAALRSIDWSRADDQLLAEAINHLKRPLPGEQLPENIRGEARTFAETNQVSIGGLGTAIRLPVFRVTLPLDDVEHELPDTIRRELFAINNARRALTLSTDLAIHNGNVERALYDLESLFRLSTHLMQQPLYVFYSEGMNTDYWALAVAVRLLEQTRPSEEQWERLDGLLADRTAHLDITQAYWGDFLVNDVDKKRTGRRWGGVALDNLAVASDWDEILTGTTYAFYEFRNRRERDRLEELDTTLRWAAKLQSPATNANPPLEEKHGPGAFVPYGLGPIFYMSSEYAWGGPVVIQEHHEAGLVSYRLLAAIAHYAQTRGAWPDTFEQLVPEFIPSVPVDPITRNPYRYIQDPEQIIITGIESESLNVRSSMRKPVLN